MSHKPVIPLVKMVGTFLHRNGSKLAELIEKESPELAYKLRYYLPINEKELKSIFISLGEYFQSHPTTRISREAMTLLKDISRYLSVPKEIMDKILGHSGELSREEFAVIASVLSKQTQRRDIWNTAVKQKIVSWSIFLLPIILRFLIQNGYLNLKFINGYFQKRETEKQKIRLCLALFKGENIWNPDPKIQSSMWRRFSLEHHPDKLPRDLSPDERKFAEEYYKKLSSCTDYFNSPHWKQ